jgi:hypothetical protein
MGLPYSEALPFLEIALVPVAFDQFAGLFVNVNHSMMCAAVVLRVPDCIN